MPGTDDLSLLSEAALAAAEIGKRYFKSDPEVWDKSGGQGPVTQADLEIDAMLKAELTAARPDYGWLSEETEDDLSRRSNERVFIVDPIDGTRAFIAGERSWSHSLAIAEAGEIVAAAVHVPMMDRLYTASKHDISRLNGTSIETTMAVEIDQATVLAAKPNMQPEFWKNGTPPLKRHFRPSLAYRLSLVAQGRFDAMLTLRDCWEWDIAAGELIVRQAGGQATDMTGAPLRFNNQRPKTVGCVAAGKPLHTQIIDRLRQPA
ncbi:MAG: 3'(2'),5'-bisphosphate nucleotidase CysQ [Pseudomonadota bacterium]